MAAYSGYDGGGALLLINSAHLDVPLNWQPAAFSFSFWLKPTRLYDYGQLTGAKARWGAFLFHSAANGQIYVGTDLSNRIVTQVGTMQTNVWQHFVFTFANGVGSLYMNGKLLSSKSGMAASQPWQGMSLGYNGAEGIYDEVRVYNRAISAQEAAGLCGHYEAEEIPAYQLVRANIGNNNGVTYAENLTQAGSASQAGSTVPFTVSVPEAGVYTITARYAAAIDYVRTLSVYVNGVDVAQAQFPPTGSWASWSKQNVRVALQQGNNTITYRYDADDNGWVNLDYIDVNSATTSGYISGSAASGALPAEISVDKFTGTANFNAPLYTVTVPGFSLPIALQYAATGVQTEDTGGEVGINWSLQAGLGIHRQVRDLPDDLKFENSATSERRYGWLRYTMGSSTANTASVPNALATISSSCTTTEQNALTQLTRFGPLNRSSSNATMYDTEPDVFTYAVPGYGGKFIFDENKIIRMLPYAPLQIKPLFDAQSGELTGFTIKTAEGIFYRFTVPERVSQQTQSSAPYGGTKYQLRHYWNFHPRGTNESGSYNGPTNLDYSTGWLVSEITTPAASNSAVKPANSIIFTYDGSSYIPIPENTSNMFLLGASANYPSSDHTLVTRALTNPKLVSITTASAVLTFSRELDESDNFHITALTIASPLEQNTLIKSYGFSYTGNGRFLTRITLNRAASMLPLYAFSYAADVTTGAAQPLADKGKTGLNQDYWGYANNNGASTSIPKLYLYPQLLATGTPVPAAPYRLYPVAAYQNGGVELPGADRRPAARLNVALAGTLTEVKFATGGKLTLEYEQNQFYDPVAQQSLPAGGLRIRTIKVQDPITQVETRRDYGYQQANSSANGLSSGVLLHQPRFAFAMPLTTSAQWADVTVRSPDDLAPDPFESRVVGYRQVTESVPGKGQVITTFLAPGGSDENASPGNATTNLPAWQRPVFGVARQASNGACPSVAPLQAVAELYPFAPPPNYDFSRGLPLSVQYRAEPTSATTPGALLRQEDYTYQYSYARPDLSAVTGLRYEQLGEPSTSLYAYAKYSLLTDYLYLPQQQVTSQYEVGSTIAQTTTSYRYNSQGWLAAKIMLGSDNMLTRTRYKYLSDYLLPTTGTSGALQAMSTRVNTEGINSDPVETISEIRPLGSSGHVAYAGATLQTFTTATLPDPTNNSTALTTPTYPYQLRRWQPAQPVATYDSVRIVNNALYIPPALRLVSTVQAVNLNLTPLSLRTETGRQLQAKQVGYGGLLPLLQIANASAAEVVFSDFEMEPFSFANVVNSAGQLPYASLAAARTGQQGLVLFGGSSLACSLPASTAPQYRLVYWARTAAPATSTVTISLDQSTPFSQTVSHSGTGQWQRFELLLPLVSLANRTSYKLAITAASGATTIQVDDVLLLPADAAAASTTYTLASGKTSETDGRGRTTYYEYGPTGDLAVVRDANQAIVHQYQKVLPGKTPVSGISFTTSGTMIEGSDVAFMATASLTGDLTYKWDFGDGTILSYPANTAISHSYTVIGQNQVYMVRLYVKSQGVEYQISQPVLIIATPLQIIRQCTAGVVSIDDCKKGSFATQVDSGCNPQAPDPNNSTTFQVSANLGGVTYQWESIYHDDPASGWQPVSPANTTNTLTIPKYNRYSYRCRVTKIQPDNSQQEVLSDEFAIMHFKSDLNCP